MCVLSLIYSYVTVRSFYVIRCLFIICFSLLLYSYATYVF